jgi:hypothetical protein
MNSYTLSYPLLYRRRPRAFFLARSAHQMKSLSWLRELGRAAMALGGLAAWGGVLLLVAG